jgi:cytochrome c553
MAGILTRTCIAAGLLLAGGQGGAAANDSRGAQIAAACASCHAPAESDRGIPPILGLAERAIIDAVLAYRASETPSHVMHAVALSLTDEELAEVAHYLSTHGEEGSAP